MPDVRRGDVVLVAFPFVQSGEVHRKLRPAVVVQSDRYNRRRAAIVLAAVTSTKAHRDLPCKVMVQRSSSEGRAAGLLTDSVIDCQALVTLAREEVVRRVGTLPPSTLAHVDRALADALGLPTPSRRSR